MLDRNAVGRTTPPTLCEVEKGAIRRFAESLGDYNPSYFDVEYARASGLREKRKHWPLPYTEEVWRQPSVAKAPMSSPARSGKRHEFVACRTYCGST